MAIYPVEIQDNSGNIYHPQTKSNLVSHGNSTVETTLNNAMPKSGGIFTGDVEMEEVYADILISRLLTVNSSSLKIGVDAGLVDVSDGNFNIRNQNNHTVIQGNNGAGFSKLSCGNLICQDTFKISRGTEGNWIEIIGTAPGGNVTNKVVMTPDGLFIIEGNNGVIIRGVSDSNHRAIAASAFNVNSSLRYKENIASINLNESTGLLNIDVSSYNYIIDTEDADGNKPLHMGVIAEQLHENGLTNCVAYDDEGRPDAVDYGKLTPYLIMLAQHQEARLQYLEMMMGL